ncbi:MAG: lectin-like protein [Myxococcota bacterium]|nr:lectin-like protein [Myxococcota bacterium]
MTRSASLFTLLLALASGCDGAPPTADAEVPRDGATDGGVTDGGTCTPACDDGATRCEGGAVERCVPDATGCPAWAVEDACDPDAEYCDPMGTEAVCAPGCEGDQDCDGAATADDCDDTDPTLGDRAADMDCDGVPTADDCDDADASVGSNEGDLDCDGVSAFVDCDDTDAAVGADPADADCDGSPDVVTFEKASMADPTDAANQDCITAAVCVTRASSEGIYNAVSETSYDGDASPADVTFARGYVGQGAALEEWESAVEAGSWWTFQPMAMRLVTDGLDFNVVTYRWGMAGSGGAFAWARSAVTSFAKADATDPTDPAHQDCVTPGVCLTRGDATSLYNAAAETTADGDSPAGTEWAPMATAEASAADYGTFEVAFGASPADRIGQVASLHVLGSDLYFDVVLTAWGDAGGFAWSRSRAIVIGCMDASAANHDARATADDGFCGDWQRFAVPSEPDTTLAENQDCLVPEVCLTRGRNQGLFNAASESGYGTGSPYGTGWTDTDTASALPSDYLDWASMVDESPPSKTNIPLSVTVPTARRAWELVVLRWPGNGSGGGVTYVRREATLAGACGDGTVDVGEVCDDGNTTDGDGCQSNCTLEGCGNAIVESASETCDEGPANSSAPGATCRPDCDLAGCGDGILDPGETCDDGNTDAGDGCDASCAPEAGWTCDMESPSACAEVCGDGLVVGVEQCDDGNTTPADGCSAVCIREECGNGIVDPAEVCDDGNMVSGDGCENDCDIGCGTHTGASLGALATDGQCVLAFAESTVWSRARVACQAVGGELATIEDATENARVAGYTAYLGASAWIGFTDAAVEGSFEWLSGSTATYTNWNFREPNDAGSGEDCTVVRTDGRWNDANCDGSLAAYVCETRCGDGVLDAGEACDAGAANSNAPGSACRTNCTTAAACGDGILDPGEDCDDGNTTDGDGCSSACGLACGGSTGGDVAVSSPSDASCFVGFASAADQATAEARCVSLGGHLATVADAAENAALGTLSPYLGPFYIGLTDAAVEGTFVWVSGDPVTYTSWASGEPNDAGRAEDCAQIRSDNDWNDVRCTETLTYVCELP